MNRRATIILSQWDKRTRTLMLTLMPRQGPDCFVLNLFRGLGPTATVGLPLQGCTLSSHHSLASNAPLVIGYCRVGLAFEIRLLRRYHAYSPPMTPPAGTVTFP